LLRTGPVIANDRAYASFSPYNLLSPKELNSGAFIFSEVVISNYPTRAVIYSYFSY
jgi:hypothetical protein